MQLFSGYFTAGIENNNRLIDIADINKFKMGCKYSAAIIPVDRTLVICCVNNPEWSGSECHCDVRQI
jgi:hypothetical protein